MNPNTKKALRQIGEIIITIITALLTTLGAHATNLVNY
ncbi:MAG: smalltalk protein [Bacteroidaceae bacterium]|nr:smalltalk protein [Bacteroidaceae bacterium]